MPDDHAVSQYRVRTSKKYRVNIMHRRANSILCPTSLEHRTNPTGDPAGTLYWDEAEFSFDRAEEDTFSNDKRAKGKSPQVVRRRETTFGTGLSDGTQNFRVGTSGAVQIQEPF